LCGLAGSFFVEYGGGQRRRTVLLLVVGHSSP
jgi:hypothetical protein